MQLTHSGESRLPRAAILLVGLFVVVITVAWVGTVQTATNLGELLSLQFSGSTPTSILPFFGLVAVMMTAMMLPAAIPMLATYRSVAIADVGRREADIRTTFFAGCYLVVWAVIASIALVVLGASGLKGPLVGIWIVVPGIVLIAAGAYQFSAWKQFCLSRCRTPLSFIMTNWRAGRRGAFRMGFRHSEYCLGCCWLLMLVVFVTGAMSLLWMGTFTGLVLAEKVWSRGVLFSRLVGGAAVAVGALILGLAALS